MPWPRDRTTGGLEGGQSAGHEVAPRQLGKARVADPGQRDVLAVARTFPAPDPRRSFKRWALFDGAVTTVYPLDMAVDPEGARFRLGEAHGHYESWFVRGNHPTRPLAFWVRYTVTSPAGRPQDAAAELFAIAFDGERGRHTVAREKHALIDTTFPSSGLGVRIANARLERDHAYGTAQGPDKDSPGAAMIAWDMSFDGGGAPLLLLPEGLYDGGFPRAKSLVMQPNVTFRGKFQVGHESTDVTGWRGSVNHNWGERHTDRYAWGQVAGFPDAHDTFLEVATARIRLGPVLSPPMTPVVLRHRGHEYRLNKLRKLFGRAKINGLEWSFKARGEGIQLRATIRAAPVDVVALYYDNPSGGRKICINTKIGECDLELTTATGVERLRSPHGAAFELLVDALADTGMSHLPTPL